MSGSWTRTLIKDLSSKEFRDAYVAEDIRTGIAFQLRALREKRGWSQAELGRRAGKPQSVISRLEDPDYGRLSLQTLLELASAFDVALLVRFVSFSELVKRNQDLSPEALGVPEFAEDRALSMPESAISDLSSRTGAVGSSGERANIIPFRKLASDEAGTVSKIPREWEKSAGAPTTTWVKWPERVLSTDDDNNRVA